MRTISGPLVECTALVVNLHPERELCNWTKSPFNEDERRDLPPGERVRSFLFCTQAAPANARKLEESACIVLNFHSFSHLSQVFHLSVSSWMVCTFTLTDPTLGSTVLKRANLSDSPRFGARSCGLLSDAPLVLMCGMGFGGGDWARLVPVPIATAEKS